jgi:hypothetical protein
MAGREFERGHEPEDKKSEFSGFAKVPAGQDVNAEDVLKKLDEADVEVISGSSDGKFKLSGKRVSAIRKHLVDAFAIPGNSQAYVNGNQVDETHIVQAGQTLEFIQPSGVKG